IKLCEAQEEMRNDIGKPKQDWQKPEGDATLIAKIRELAQPHFAKVAGIYEKAERSAALDEAKNSIVAALEEEYPDIASVMKEVFEEEYSASMREAVLSTGIRADGRKLNEI